MICHKTIEAALRGDDTARASNASCAADRLVRLKSGATTKLERKEATKSGGNAKVSRKSPRGCNGSGLLDTQGTLSARHENYKLETWGETQQQTAEA